MWYNSELVINNKFLLSCDNYDLSDKVIVGIPMDFTCSLRPGARFGPAKIREMSIGLEEYSPYMDKTLEDIKFYDCGDINLPFGNVEGSLSQIEQVTKNVLNDKKVPIFIGGEHLVTYPILKEFYKKYQDELIIIHFDAHTDLREDYMGYKNSHASVIKRCIEFIKPKNIYQFGIRSGTKEEFTYAKENMNIFKFEVFEPLKNLVDDLAGKPVYITIDIDVADPAYANGTGTPEPGGISSVELINSVILLKNLNIVGFDLVEVSPVYDHSDRTAILAAKIIREILLM